MPWAFSTFLLLILTAKDCVAQSPLPQSGVADGAAYGATVGLAGVGLLFGYVGAGLCDAAVCDDAFAEGFIIGAAVGTLVGAGVGAAIGSRASGPPRRADLKKRPALRLGFDYGRPKLVAGTGRSTAWATRLQTGWHVGAGTIVGAEWAVVDFAERRRLEPPGSGVLGVFDEDVRLQAALLSLTYEVMHSGSLRVRGAVGPAHTTMGRRIVVDRGLAGVPLSENGWGAQLSLAVDAGWAVPGTNALHVGFRARIERITASPVGAFGLATFSAGLWN